MVVVHWALHVTMPKIKRSTKLMAIHNGFMCQHIYNDTHTISTYIHNQLQTFHYNLPARQVWQLEQGVVGEVVNETLLTHAVQAVAPLPE